MSEREPEENGTAPQQEYGGYGGVGGGAAMEDVYAAANGEAGIESKEFLQAVTDYEKLTNRVQKIAGAILSRRLSVTKFDKTEIHEIRYLIKNDFQRARMQYPPKESCMQGGLRKHVYGDNKKPLTEHEKNQLKSVERSVIAALKQSEGGWLLEKVMSEVTQVSRQEQSIERGQQQNESWINKIFG